MGESIGTALVTGVFGVITLIVTAIVNSKSKKRENNKAPSLKEHIVFAKIEMLKSHIDIGFSLENKGKEILFKDMLKQNLNVWKETLLDMSEDLDKQCDLLDDVEFQNVVFGCFEKGLKSYNDYYKNSHYNSDEQAVLDIVMDSFNKWNYPRANSFREAMVLVCGSQYYNNHRIKSAIILDMYIALFADVISDAQFAMGELDKEIEGRIFKGVEL